MQKSEVGLPQDVVLRMVARLMRFPGPQICRHLVAANLLSALEEHGLEPTPEFQKLAKAVVQADDETALDVLQKTYQIVNQN